MSKVATDKKNWLDVIKEDAKRITKRRLEDDGLEATPQPSQAEERAEKATEAEVVETKKTKK